MSYFGVIKKNHYHNGKWNIKFLMNLKVWIHQSKRIKIKKYLYTFRSKDQSVKKRQVVFELQQGKKGLNAVNVKLLNTLFYTRNWILEKSGDFFLWGFDTFLSSFVLRTSSGSGWQNTQPDKKICPRHHSSRGTYVLENVFFFDCRQLTADKFLIELRRCSVTLLQSGSVESYA